MGNIVSVCVGDHFCSGSGRSRLSTPEDAFQRLRAWRDELCADTVHWREVTTLAREFRFYGPDHRGRRFPGLPWDEIALVPRMAHELGMKAMLHVSLFDEGWPLPPRRIRERCYHTWAARHLAWQSDFSRRHPEFALVDRAGRRRLWGVLCLADPEVRRHFLHRFRTLLAGGAWDGLFVCLRSQSPPAIQADQFGYNEPVLRDYRARYGRAFEVRKWRDLLGGTLTLFLRELRPHVPRLGVGIPRGNILGPPIGNMTLPWRDWNGLVDDLIVDQDSSRCPADGHLLWPMRRGEGYLEDYRAPQTSYAFLEDYPAVYVARQWRARSEAEERRLLARRNVRGLVLGSFCHDGREARCSA